MVLLPVGADLGVISRGPVVDDLNALRQPRLREDRVQRPVEDQRVLVVDRDIDGDLEPVHASLLRCRHGVRPFKHGYRQLDKSESEQNGKGAHQQVGSLKREVKVGSPPRADGSADEQDEPRGQARAPEADTGDVVGVDHKSPRSLRRRQSHRIATVSTAVLAAVSMTAHVSTLRTGDMTHTFRLAELPDLVEVVGVIQLTRAVDQPVRA